MPQRLAYLVTARLEPQTTDEGCNPRPEYAIFVERNRAALLDYRNLDGRDSPMMAYFKRRHLRHIALPMVALERRAEYSGFVVSGEDAGLPMALLARKGGIRYPIYIITHGSYFGARKMQIALTLLKGCKNIHFMCLSETLRRAMVEQFRFPEAQVHNASYGVDTAFFRTVGATSTPTFVASAGTANRDYRTLVRAAASLPIELKIAVDSAWFPLAVDIADDTLPPNIEARSYGDYRGLRGLYGSAAFVVVPLYPAKHACGYAVIAEAMAMGKPVIATKTEMYSDFIVEGETGYHVPPGDADALREKMVYLIANPDEAQRMGQNARRRMEQMFSVEAYCERMKQIIQSGMR
jgi:glycosyltransferase involved in cell wall biosynthesis